MNVVDGTCRKCGAAIRMFPGGPRICRPCAGLNPMTVRKVVVKPCSGVDCKCGQVEAMPTVAIVRNIPEYNKAITREHHDIFLEDMVECIGTLITVKPRERCPDWYICEDDWNYHASWLDFIG